MKERNIVLGLLLILLNFNVALGTAEQAPTKASLCGLQETVRQGDRVPVRVDGIYTNGFVTGVLTDPACPYEHTWVELDLQSTLNMEALRSLLEKSGQAHVVFEGELCGPSVPDAKLPESVKRTYRPGWGHLGAFRTKLVVHAIRGVEQLPEGHAIHVDVDHGVPVLRRSALPVYPPIARAARVTGTVSVRVSVKDGLVVRTEVLSRLEPAAQRFLEGPTVENLTTWRFDTDVNREFAVTYSYAIGGEETEEPTNATIEMLPSLDVSITARPVKPAVMYDVGVGDQ